MTIPIRHAYSHLETDTELINRASGIAHHRITAMCCGRSYMGSTTDQLAEGHGVQRRIVWCEE